MPSPQFDGLYVSVSQIKCFIACPMRYYLKYVAGLEPAFVPVALAFGTAFHRALAFYYTAIAEVGRAPGLDYLVGTFQEAWAIAATGPVPLQGDEEDDAFDPISKGAAMLAAFHEHAATGPPPDVVAVERSFEVDLHDPQTGEILDLKFVGTWDLLVREDERMVVVEHKSSSRRYAGDQLRYDIQPTAYQFAARQLGLGQVGLRYQIVTKSKTPAVQVEDLRRDDSDERDFLRTVVGVLRAIEARAIWPSRAWQCRSCPHAAACARHGEEVRP